MNIAIEFRIDKLQANGTYNVRKIKRWRWTNPGDGVAGLWVDPFGEQRSAAFHGCFAQRNPLTSGPPLPTPRITLSVSGPLTDKVILGVQDYVFTPPNAYTTQCVCVRCIYSVSIAHP